MLIPLMFPNHTPPLRTLQVWIRPAFFWGRRTCSFHKDEFQDPETLERPRFDIFNGSCHILGGDFTRILKTMQNNRFGPRLWHVFFLT